MLHKAPGIDDAQSRQYRDYDKSGRHQVALSNKAALSGQKGLTTHSVRADSPVSEH